VKLIAESNYENQILNGLVCLLSDLGMDVTGYQHEEAVAATFWSADDFTMEISSMTDCSKTDREAFLLSIEEIIRGAMIEAGYNVI